MLIQNWADIIIFSFQQVWIKFAGFMPSLLGAVIVFIVGLVVAAGLGALVEKVIGILKVDSVVSKLGVEEYVERAGLRLNSGRFLGQIVYWFFVIVALLVTTNILGLPDIGLFLMGILGYIPNVVVAVIIMLSAVVIGNFLKRVVRASVMSAKLHAANVLGTITWYSVIVFGLTSALAQLNVDVTILNTLITGIIAMLAIAGGIAFGLGGKEYASHLIEKFRGQVEHK